MCDEISWIMYTFIKTLSFLYADGRSNDSYYPLYISAQFKKPLFIPNTAIIRYKNYIPTLDKRSMFCYEERRSTSVHFELSSKNPSSLNMIGYLTYKAVF